ncbi:MAG: hypothetical protein L0216_06620, partial [Planctomycetales bacterium]|nr:hypothetical protein [Planctomycetales bacterium]
GALREALEKPGPGGGAALEAASVRFADQTAGRGAGRAARARRAASEDEALAAAAEAARALAAGSPAAGATAVLARIEAAKTEACAGAARRVRGAIVAAERVRSDDAPALSEARYHLAWPEVEALARSHRFADARARLGEVVAGAGHRSAEALAEADGADLALLEDLGAAARIALAGHALSGRPVSVGSRAGMVRGVVEAVAGSFRLREGPGRTRPLDLPDLSPAGLLQLADTQGDPRDARRLLARGILLFLNAQDVEAKRALDAAWKADGRRHRYQNAIVGREIGETEPAARAERSRAEDLARRREPRAARDALSALLREYRGTALVREEGPALRDALRRALDDSIAAHGAPFLAAAVEIERSRDPAERAAARLRAALAGTDPAALESQIADLSATGPAAAAPRLVLLLESAPAAARPRLVATLRAATGADAGEDPAAWWTALGQESSGR